MNILQIQAISEVKEASDGRKYKTVSFQPVSKLVKREGREIPVLSNVPPTGRNVWEKGPQRADGTASAGDPLFSTAKVGALVEGSYERRKVQEYEIDGRTVSTYSAIIFGHENVEQYFGKQGHPLVAEGSATSTSEAEAIEIQAGDEPNLLG